MSSATLADTGSPTDTKDVAVLAGVLILAGIALTRGTRRRPTKTP